LAGEKGQGAVSATLAERLGFEATDRVVIVHCDDIGMCQAANEGAFEALANGPATCGSVMVPCPGFGDSAERARANPELDLGVHLTLNAEYPRYRWGPVAGASAVPSLVDEQGYLPRTSAELLARAQPEQVEIELRAQLERALAAGIDVTHVDAHMGTAFLPPFVESYARLAHDYRLPVFAVRPEHEALVAIGAEGDAELYRQVLGGLEADGVPILDGFDADSLVFEPGGGEAHNAARLAGLRRGVNYLVCHPARDGPELSAITPDAPMRDFERRFYGGEAGRRAFEEQGLRRVGMRPLRDLVRGQMPFPRG
jgi:predicted glycoside hydrolase/deacetylase ChbG (UPF0249 family)